jgi:hypothetical protein
MKWIPRYIWKLVVWSFTRLRIHQAIVAVIVGGLFIVGWLIGIRISWLSTAPQIMASCLVVWFIILILFVAPACLWHELELHLAEQPRPWVIIDHYDFAYIKDDETGEESPAETLHIVNRGGAPAVSIKIPPIAIEGIGRKAELLKQDRFFLDPGESRTAQILNLKYVLEKVNQRRQKVIGRPWFVRIPLTVEYYDRNNVRWTTDHAITFNVRGISIDIVHPNEPQEWTDVPPSKD